MDTDQAPAIAADGELVQIIFNNLLDNAVSYAREGGHIDIRLGKIARRLTVEIANTGHALSPDDVVHLGERFWRKDEARSTTGIHAGLGLSLCQRLLALQQGTLGLRIEGDLFIASLELPLFQEAPRGASLASV
jgi:signal transduction histidine kinase